MNVLWAYTLCQCKRYVRTPVTLVWLFALPVVLLVTLGGARISLLGASAVMGMQQENDIPYAGFLLMGLIGLSITSGSLFGLGVVLVQAREHGILQRLALTPQPTWKFVAGQILASGIMVLLVTGWLLAVGLWVFDVPLPQRFIAWFLVLGFGTVALLTMGYALAAIMRDVRTAQVVSNTAVWVSTLLGDVWLPLSALPPSVQQLSQLLPLTHFLRVLREVGLAGQPVQASLGSLAVLTLWSTVAVTFALVQFRRRQD